MQEILEKLCRLEAKMRDLILNRSNGSAAEPHSVALIENRSAVTTVSTIRGKEEKQMECPHCRNNSEKWMPQHPEYEQNMMRTPKQPLLGAHIESKVCADCGFIVRQISRNDLEKCNPVVGFPGG